MFSDMVDLDLVFKVTRAVTASLDMLPHKYHMNNDSFCSQGKVEESIKYLEMFVDVAEKSKDDRAISRACSDLGAMFNTLVTTWI